ncbi:hypothetical protein MRB53_017921 [Persea americana]|uniref:Uncharacterized protein n=1 Tax=Persea americana TaxID=3435 RepID=A0ACC2M6E8_PERAE|nr:hypothetical protein MRB53_017921 [Persea americana]
MASTISLEEIKNENVDLERIPVEEVFEQLKCSRQGLSDQEGEKRLQIFGPNKLEEKKDRVKPSPLPDSWKLKEIFATGVVLGSYLAVMTVIFFWGTKDSDFFTVATIIAVYADWGFARIKGIGWGWAGVIWVYSIIFYFPLDVLKFLIRYALSGKAWNNMLDNKTAFTSKKDYGRGEREAQWALAQRTLHGLQPPESAELFNDKNNNYRDLSELAEQAKKRAEIARLRELHTLKGHVESVVKLKGLDIDTMQQHYTV